MKMEREMKQKPGRDLFFMIVLIFQSLLLSGCGPSTDIDSTLSTDVDSTLTSNTKPVAYDKNITTEYTTQIDFNITGSDADYDTFTFVIESNTSHGTIKLIDAITGDVRYTKDNNYFGSDYFTFKVVDEWNTSSNIADVNITIKPCSAYTTEANCGGNSYCYWLLDGCVLAAP